MATAIGITWTELDAAGLRCAARRSRDAAAARRMLALALLLEGKSRMQAEQETELAKWVRQGPDLAEHGVVRWRRADLAQAIKTKFGVVLAERSVSDVLRRLGFRRLVARPRHPEHDAAAQASFRATSPPS